MQICKLLIAFLIGFSLIARADLNKEYTLLLANNFSAIAFDQCRNTDPFAAYKIFLKAEKKQNVICMLTARESIIENTFKMQESSYLQFLKILGQEISEREQKNSDDEQLIDPVQNLLKGLQEKWFDLYIFHATGATRLSTFTTLAASSAATTVATIYLFKAKGALSKGMFRAWRILLLDILQDKTLLTSIMTAVGVSASHSSGKLTSEDQVIPQAPFEVLKINSSQYWSRTEYALIRDVIAYSTSTTIGVMTGNKVSKSATEVLSNGKDILIKDAQSPIQKYLLKILNSSTGKLKPVFKVASKVTGLTPMSLVISYIVSDLVLTQTEKGINAIAERISEEKLRKLESKYLENSEHLSDIQFLNSVEEHVGALLWYSAVRSKLAVDSLTEAESNFLNDYACNSMNGINPMPFFTREAKRKRFLNNLYHDVQKSLQDWNARRLDNIQQLSRTIQNLKKFDRSYLNSFIARLEGAKAMYEIAGDPLYQYNSIYQRVSRKLGTEFMQPNYSDTVEDEVMTKMQCRGNSDPQIEFGFVN